MLCPSGVTSNDPRAPDLVTLPREVISRESYKDSHEDLGSNQQSISLTGVRSSLVLPERSEQSYQPIISRRRNSKVGLASGFVKISAHWFVVDIFTTETSFLLTASLK